ncbi:MAG: molybdopterin molybdotransferase MoeA, partial [Bacteroidota bacterium]|nr:molybdopterin molybdotransferase MoeA [Bacteroidota bacterium]
MISVREAKIIIQEHIVPLAPVDMLLQDAGGLVLAEDVLAKTNIPAFDQSAMDGYAFLFEDWLNHKTLKIYGEIQAGMTDAVTLLPGQAIRIFTGAPLPQGADTVVMQEKVKIENGELIILDENIQAGRNKRPIGSEIKAGAVALVESSILNPAAIGFLAGIGIDKVQVYPRPCISIIVTGKELRPPGKQLKHGEVYESNSFALKAALNQMHYTNIKVNHCDDILELLINKLKAALLESDIVILTGGVSVGDYDFVLEAAVLCGVEKRFHKVKQKPGKPLYYGMKGNKPVFGLPGNPSSVLSCFYQYVIPALCKLSKHPNAIKTIETPLANSYEKPSGITHFLKAYYNG